MIKEGLEYLREKYTRPENYPQALTKWYEKNTGLKLDLNDPKTYNEKIQWIKLNYANPRVTKLSDKLAIRPFIEEKIGKEYLIPLLGVYDKFSDIDFDKLPDRFALKTNLGSSWNVIVKDKAKLDMFKTRMKFFLWTHLNFAYTTGYQLQYVPIKPRILAEEYMENEDGSLRDYKVLTFGGKAHYIWVDTGRYTEHHRNFYDTDWNPAPFEIFKTKLPNEIPRPVNLEKMLELAEILAHGYPMVRVDFYEVEGKLYFGEMTFTSASGIELFRQPEYDRIIGDMIPIP